MNAKILTKYINVIYITIIIVFFFLRIRVDVVEELFFNIEKYFLLIVLTLIFYFDNIFIWIIGIVLCIYGIYEICYISIHQAMPGVTNFAFEPFYYHLPICSLTSRLKHDFSYWFYVSMIIYSLIMIAFKLFQKYKFRKREKS